MNNDVRKEILHYIRCNKRVDVMDHPEYLQPFIARADIQKSDWLPVRKCSPKPYELVLAKTRKGVILAHLFCVAYTRRPMWTDNGIAGWIPLREEVRE